MAGGTFPTSVPSYPAISPSETLATAGGGVGLEQLLEWFVDDTEALATKLGTGSSVAAANSVAVGTGTGVTSWLAGLTAAYFASGVLFKELLSPVTLGSAAAQIDLASIPQTHTSLLIEVEAKSVGAVGSDNLAIRVGNASIDTGSHYTWVQLYGNLAAASSNNSGTGLVSLMLAGAIPDASSTVTTTWGKVYIFIPGYRSARKKDIVVLSFARTANTSAGLFLTELGGSWDDTSVIQNVRLLTFSGSNLATGSTARVLGIP